MPTTHITGIPLHVGDTVRQRCGWCGALLVEEPLDTVPLMWPDGGLLREDGGYYHWIDADLDPAPSDLCAFG